MNNIKYKFLTVDDINRNYNYLLDLLNMIFKENISQDFNDNLVEIYIKSLPQYINDGSAIVIGAFDNNQLIGFHWCYYLDVFGERRVHSYFVGINSKYQGKGIASKMLREIENIAKSNGVFIIESMVTYNNKNALAFHQNKGFEIERLKMKRILK